ncbi:RDD family protein [Niabella soli]|uniref:Transporter n=1 Tax=Niabella soli DSM 19437 TaxID=929713 RepID=W0EXK3_9BACT|nr:RDD family protein [Niabella soli]AHF15502.1 transporter [Niabella soli DSM 19437]
MTDPNYGPQGPAEPNPFNNLLPVQYGNFWERFAAALIDGLVIGVAWSIIASLLGINFLDRHIIESDSGSGVFNYWSFGPRQGVPILIYWLYFAFMESGPKQATLGKMALGLKVTNTHGQPISFLNATGRFFGKYVSAIILFIGFLMVLWDDKCQALHDKLAGTLVVKK